MISAQEIHDKIRSARRGPVPKVGLPFPGNTIVDVIFETTSEVCDDESR